MIYQAPWVALSLTATFDHAKYIKDFVKMGIDTYSSRETFEVVGATGHRTHVINDGDIFTVGTSTILAFSVKHDFPNSFGFLIANDKEKILFITDLAYSRHRFAGITRLIIEANFSEKIVKGRLERGEIDQFRVDRLIRSHMSIERVKDLIGANSWPGLKEVHLIHLSDGNSSEEIFKNEIQKIIGVPVYVCGK